jgi:hypothetical protein
MLYRGNSIEGSNPSLSASPVRQDRIFFAWLLHQQHAQKQGGCDTTLFRWLMAPPGTDQPKRPDT